jgi:hypothetical protein
MPNAIVFVSEVIVMDGPMWTRTSESRWPRLGMEEWTGCCQDCNIMKLKMGGRIVPSIPFCDYYASSTPTPAIRNGVTHIIVSKKEKNIFEDNGWLFSKFSTKIIKLEWKGI